MTEQLTWSTLRVVGKRLREADGQLQPWVRTLICIVTTTAYVAVFPFVYGTWQGDALDLLMLPIAAFAAMFGSLVGLTALAVGIGLMGTWASQSGVPVTDVANAPHVVGGAALAFGFGYMQRVLLVNRRQKLDLDRSHATIRSVIGSAPLILWAVDARGILVLRDGKGLASVGQTPGGWVGRSARDLCRTEYPECPELLMFLERALAGEETNASLVVRGRTQELHFAPIRDDAGALSGAVMTAIDVTEQRAFEIELEHRALYDTLTDLPNRALLHDRLNLAIAAAARSAHPFALVVADLDNFKDVNDTFGHDRGDEVLREVAARLRGELRASDTVARLGGDEFALLVLEADEGLAAGFAKRVLDSFSRPLVLGGVGIDLSASLGIAIYPAHGSDALTLLRKADIAMYAAKRTRRAFAVYSDDRDVADPDAVGLVAALRDAIEQHDIGLAFQPEVRMSDRALTRVEALARWTHPVRGPVAPGRFIPLAERSGLMGPLTRRVLRDALGQVAAWRTEGLETVVAVNLSAQDIIDPALLSVIAEALERSGLRASALALEITESVLVTDLDRVVRRLKELRGLGISLAIDDFGTGYSSLSYLNRLPVDRLKIDRSFVARLTTDAGARAVTRAAVTMGHELGLKVVAEGVESAADWDLLGELGCDSVQGYFVSRPLAPAAFVTWSRERPDRFDGVATPSVPPRAALPSASA